jgi:hypothetical protein
LGRGLGRSRWRIRGVMASGKLHKVALVLKRFAGRYEVLVSLKVPIAQPRSSRNRRFAGEAHA